MAAVLATDGRKRTRNNNSTDDSGRVKRLFGALLLGHMAARKPEHVTMLTSTTPRLRWRPSRPDAAFLAEAERQAKEENHRQSCDVEPVAVSTATAQSAAATERLSEEDTGNNVVGYVHDVNDAGIPIAESAALLSALPVPQSDQRIVDDNFLDYS